MRVERLLVRKWSPEQIAVKLRRDHPDDPRWWVSPEAIYASLYVQGKGGLKAELTQHLRRQRTARKHGPGPGHLVDTVHISQRPAEARDRAVPGHWEGDLLLGAGSMSQVGMLAERSTRLHVVVRPARRSHAPTVRDALARGGGHHPRPAAPIADLGQRQRDGRTPGLHIGHRLRRCTSVTRPTPGSGAPPRTPSAWSGPTSPKAKTSPATPQRQLAIVRRDAQRTTPQDPRLAQPRRGLR